MRAISRVEQALTTNWTSHDQEPISTTIGSLSTAITSHAFDRVRSELRIGSDIADAPALNDWLTGPRVTGALPGPRSADMLARQARRESNPRTYPRDLPIAIDEAAGCWVRDVDGNVFIDFLTGAGVLSLGHGHRELVQVAAEQLAKLSYGAEFPTPARDAFTEAQLSMLPAGMRDRMKIHFCGPTGKYAVDAAIRLCKTATGRDDIVAFQGGLHGSSYAPMAASGLVEEKSPVSNVVPGMHFFPFAHCSRCLLGLHPDTCSTSCATYVERSLKDARSGTPLPGAVIMEVVPGEDGVVPATVEFVRRTREVTRELGIPLVVDEVPTGCGRTGTWFAFEQYGIEPDVIVASLAMGGIGAPVAIIIYDSSLDVWHPERTPEPSAEDQLAFAAGTAAVNIIRRDHLLDNACLRGAQVARLLAPLEFNPWVREVRGRGLMWGVELADPVTGLPAGGLGRAVQAAALHRGLILECGGREDCVVRMLPPLNVTAQIVDIACRILVAVIEELSPLS